MIDINALGDMPVFSGHQLGNYRLVRLLGHGGSGSVYLGEHLYLRRYAAIKVVQTALSTQDMISFLEEARLLAKLSHPHIVQVLEFAVTQRWTSVQGNRVKEYLPFLVMNYAPGGNLRNRYPSSTRLSLDEVIIKTKQIAAALQYAHDQNIIHRDVKPENLLLNERQEIMLSDFGLALLAPSPDLLSLQGMAGTLPYAAPEQLRGKPVFASDQYSLGILAYEWLCGSRPFRGNDVEIIMQQVSSPPPPLHHKNLSIPPLVEDTIFKALAKDPEHRYETVHAFAQALEDASRSRKAFLLIKPLITMPSLLAVEAPRVEEKRSFPVFRYFAQNATIKAPIQRTSTQTYVDNAVTSFLPMPSTPASRNRLRMIKKVRTFWIQGVLEKSLYGTSFIPLKLDEKSDAVDTPWSSILQRKHQSHTFPSDILIIDVYDQSAGELLILGQPGAGKTSLMLQLTSNLLHRAEIDESLPIPVVFLLSTWAEQQLPLDQWFIEELSNKYQVPHFLGEQWVHDEMLLPLLDGLDEVAASARSACIIAINSYKKNHGLSSIVVCSRFNEYLLFSPRVLLQSAVVIRPLTLQQIDTYFSSFGQKFMRITQMLREDPAFQRLVTTPLMLNIITLAYQNKSPEALLHLHSPATQYNQILNTFVEQMLLRHVNTNSYSSEVAIHQLGYIATQMQRTGEKVLYIEHIQPQWIENSRWEQWYRYIAVKLPGALIGALTGILSNILLFHAGSIGSVYIDAVYGMIMGYLFSGRVTSHVSYRQDQPGHSESTRRSLIKFEYLKTMIFVGLVTFLSMVLDKGWIAALTNGLFLGSLSMPLSLLFAKNNQEASYTKNAYDNQIENRLKIFPREHLRNGIFAGIACGLTSVITVLVTPNTQPSSFSFLLTLGIRDSLRNALLGTLLGLLLINNDGLIHPAEIISWSWKRFLRGMRGIKSILFDLLIGTVVGLTFASKQLFQGNINGAGDIGISTGLLVAIGFRLVYAIFQGVSHRNLDDNYRIRPNEGIRRSLSHGLIGGVISIPIIIVLSIITSVIISVLGNGSLTAKATREALAGINLGLSNSRLLIPCGVLLTILLLGGLARLQHSILRLILYITRGVPLKLSSFLNYAVDCIFLYKVGGGYIFIHRFLLEYFASVNKDNKDE